MGEDLIKVKIGVTPTKGVETELVIGDSLPPALAKLFPAWAMRTEIRRGVTASILKKLETGERIDRADADFVGAVCGEAEANWIRRKEIAMRAVKVLEGPHLALPPPVTGDAERNQPTSEATADEWVRRFWEDAGAISDEVLQEIYARVLASEARSPKSCSQRTLRELRYLDRETADAFARILPYALSNQIIPRGQRVLGDIPFALLLDLQDAGLIDAAGTRIRTVDPPQNYLAWGQRVIRIDCDGPGWHDGKNGISAYPLTTAGRELARVAHTEHTPDQWERLMVWLFGELSPSATVSFHDAPPTATAVDVDNLVWTPVARPAP